MVAGVALAGLAVGVLFIAVLAMVPMSPLFVIGADQSFPDPDYYPIAQIRIEGLKETYVVGERINFAVSSKGIGCTYPGSIAVASLKDGVVVWDFNAARDGGILLCPIITNPAEFSMTWKLRDYLDRLTVDEPGQYVVVVKHEHMTVQDVFAVTE